jgi:proteasome lid subunit RPN8/RPN11
MQIATSIIFTPQTKGQIAHMATSAFPVEACGFVVLKDGEQHVIRCENIASDPTGNFEIGESQTLKALLGHLGEVVALWHSHPTAAAELSDADVRLCKASQWTQLVYSVAFDTWAQLEPTPPSKSAFYRSFIGR